MRLPPRFATLSAAALAAATCLHAPSAALAGDNASVVAANLPSLLGCGANYQASVTMRNTGTTTWTSDVFKLGPVGDSDDLNGPARIYLPSGTTVPPNGQHTFAFTLRAPNTARVAQTDWRMVHEGVAWFGATAQRTVTVNCTAAIDNAHVVASDFPKTLGPGQTYRASVTVSNTGTTTWTSDLYKLGPVGDSDDLDGPGRVYLPDGAAVPPGSSHRFEFDLKAPSAETTAVTSWRMVHEGVLWFGATASATVRVETGDAATAVAWDLPKTMIRGDTYAAEITMQNSGSSTWTRDDLIRLGAAGDHDPLTSQTRIDLPRGVSVAPGQSHTFRFDLTAPFTVGRHLSDWQMVHDHVAWFGDKVASNVYVERPDNDAALAASQFPDAVSCGEDFVATMTLRNTGNLPWSSDLGYEFVPRDDDDPFVATGTRFAIPAGTTVSPGDIVTFRIPMVAPDLGATYLTDWQMVRHGNEFGEVVSRSVVVWCGVPGGPWFPTKPGLWPAAPDDSSPEDLDGDGLPQSLELQLAQYFFPTIWMDIEERCPEPGSRTGTPGRLVFRTRPHPDDPSKIAISYALLFARDCGEGSLDLFAHNGDVEPFAITVEPNPDCEIGYAARAIHTWAHEGTPVQFTEGRQLDGRCKFGFSVDVTGKNDIVVSSENKHGNYLSLDSCDNGNLWMDHCSFGFTMSGVNSWVGYNAGEPDAPRHRDLGPLGFPGELMWSSRNFCGGLERASNCPGPVEAKMSDKFVAGALPPPTPTPAVTCEFMGGDLCTTQPNCPEGYVEIGPSSNCDTCCVEIEPTPSPTPTANPSPPPATATPVPTPNPARKTCYDYTNMYPRKTLCYDDGWRVCERRHRNDGIGGILKCWKGFK